MKPRRVIFEDKDAELIYRAARLGVRGLGKHEQRRAEIALARLKNLELNMKKEDTGLIQLMREETVRYETLSELRQWQQSRELS